MILTRKDFQQLAQKRLQESQALFEAKLYEGSYHLAGLAIECAIKACIAKRTRRFEFPDKEKANKSFDHNPENLIRVAGLKEKVLAASANKVFGANWNQILDWEVESRYKLKITKEEAEKLLLSITDPLDGVLPWLQLHW